MNDKQIIAELWLLLEEIEVANIIHTTEGIGFRVELNNLLRKRYGILDSFIEENEVREQKEVSPSQAAGKEVSLPSFKERIHKALIQRMTMLERWTERDAGGSLYGYWEMWREVKYWREAIERGEFDE